MINNDWQALGVGLMDTREIMRIVTSNIARIDLPMWLRSEPYKKAVLYVGSFVGILLFTDCVINS